MNEDATKLVLGDPSIAPPKRDAKLVALVAAAVACAEAFTWFHQP